MEKTIAAKEDAVLDPPNLEPLAGRQLPVGLQQAAGGGQ
jgi:hypothetical protein